MPNSILYQRVDLARFEDERGRFNKLFNKQLPALADYSIEQINWVQNRHIGNLRGLHAQKGEAGERKLFQVLKGSIQLAMVALNPYTGQASGQVNLLLLKAGEPAVLVNKGCATGYLVLDYETEVLYCSDQPYWPEAEIGYRWDDPLFDFQWLQKPSLVSEKDQQWPWAWAAAAAQLLGHIKSGEYKNHWIGRSPWLDLSLNAYPRGDEWYIGHNLTSHKPSKPEAFAMLLEMKQTLSLLKKSSPALAQALENLNFKYELYVFSGQMDFSVATMTEAGEVGWGMS